MPGRLPFLGKAVVVWTDYYEFPKSLDRPGAMCYNVYTVKERSSPDEQN